MSEQHTQGRMAAIATNAEPELRDDTGRTTAVIVSGNLGADARRLAACWNACQGLSTEALERYHGNGGIEDATDEDKDAVLNELQAQRDRLQAVAVIAREFIAVDLKDLTDSLTVHGVLQTDDQDKRAIAEYDTILTQIDAALSGIEIPAHWELQSETGTLLTIMVAQHQVDAKLKKMAPGEKIVPIYRKRPEPTVQHLPSDDTEGGAL